MGVFDKLVLPPSAEHLTLLKYLLALLYLIHVPFISMLMGSALFSVAFNWSDRSAQNPRHLRFARDLIGTFAQNIGVGITLGLLPLVTMSLIYTQILQGADVVLPNVFGATILVVVAGLALLYLYQRSFDMRDRKFGLHIGSGILGTLLLFGAYLLFTSATSLVMDPEKWRIVREPGQMLFSWNVVVRYQLFLFNAFAITGTGILFFLLRWKQPETDPDPEYATFVKRFGGGVALTFILMQPLFVLWGLSSLPKIALSAAGFVAAAVALLLLLILALLLVSFLRSSGTHLASHLFVFSLLLVLVLFIGESASRESAIQEHTGLLITQAEELEVERLLARGVEGGGSDVKRGESVFKQRCSICHAFDKRVVGPPLVTILPEYKDNLDDLIGFIRNPTKMNPQYPTMPKLGLKEIEIKSVAAYVLSQITALSQSTDEGKGEQ